MHLRSLRGLLKVSVRKIRGLRRSMLMEKAIEDNFTVASEKGDINKTKKSLIQLLDLFKGEEKNIITIEENEMRILHDEVADEAKDFQDLLKLLADAKNRFPNLRKMITEIEEHFSTTLSKEGSDIKTIVKESLDMFRDRSSRLRYANLTTNNFTSGTVFRELKDELGKLSELQRDEADMKSTMGELESALKSKKDELSIAHILKKINETIKKEMKASEELVQDVHNVMHALNIVTIHYLNAVMEDEDHRSIHQKFAKLMKEGYPKDILNPIESSFEGDRKAALGDFRHMFELARWMGYEVQAQQRQAA